MYFNTDVEPVPTASQPFTGMTRSELVYKITLLKNCLEAYHHGDVVVSEPGRLKAELQTFQGKLDLGLYRKDSVR